MKRRDFLKAAPAALGLAVSRPVIAGRSSQNVRMPSAAYTPDYPIRPQPYSAVTLTDTFWQPKVATNARVTIPFEVQKLTENEAGSQRQRARSGDAVAEDASRIRDLQARVEARVAQLRTQRTARQQRVRGRRDPLSSRRAGAICSIARSRRRRRSATTSFANNPPFSGGERDAINCVQLYRVDARQEASRSGEALSRHSRARELGQSQPPQPVVQARPRAERSGRPRGQLRRRCMVSLADVGVLTGLDEYLARRRSAMWTDAVDAEDVRHGRRRIDGQRRVRRAVRRCRTSPRTPRRAPS